MAIADIIGIGGSFIRKCIAFGHAMVLICVIVSATVISGLAAGQTISAKDLTYITEQYPPYNYQEDGKLQGISVDLLEEIWEKMGAGLNRSAIKLLSWTEGYERVLKENNTVLFTTWRIPEREQLFKWVGPVASGSDVLLAKSDKNISITAPSDLKKYKIGGIENDIAVQRLLNSGAKKEDLILETNSTPIIEMIKNGTIDAWAYNDIAGIWLLQQSGANASDYRVACVLAQGNGYYAFNEETPDSIVQSFQQALDQIKNNKDSSGISDYQKIIYKYIPLTLNRIPAAVLAQAEHKGGILSVEDPAPDMLFMLLQIQAEVQGSLNDLDADVANAAQSLSAAGMEGPAAREVLRKLPETNSNLVSAATFSKDGRIIAVECKGCEGGEGADISSQDHIAHVLKTKNPSFSKQLLLVEGYNGTALAYPVFSPQGEFIGGISAIIEPDKLLNALIAPQLHFDIYAPSNITDYTFWVMDLDGLLVYDEDVSQIGKNLFEVPLYRPFPSLLDLSHRIVAERSGHGYYSYFQITEGNKTAVNKECYWSTAGLHGREWRLVVAKIVQ